MSRYSWFEDRADRLRADGQGAAAAATYGGWLYGDGSDGPLTLHDGDVLQPGFYTDITIVAGATVTVPRAIQRLPAVHCTGTWTINGTVDLRGPDAVGRLNADNPSQVGVAFDTGPATTSGANLSAPFLGGLGGDGAAGPTSAPNGLPAVDPSALSLVRALTWGAIAGGSYQVADYGVGGMGGGDNTNYGGAGGNAGRAFVLVARHLVHGPASSYLIAGGKGGDGGDDGAGSTGHGDCGGGGGGAGGWWMTVSDDITGSTAVIGTGGAGGAGSGTGADGQPGMTGRGIHLLNRES